MFLATSLLIAFAALLIERAIGYPTVIQRTFSHPVVWIGRLIGLVEARLNRPGRQRLKGLLALMIVLAAVLAVSLPVTVFLRSFAWGWLIEAMIATAFLAQADLRRHVVAVADGLDDGHRAGRAAVSHLVGRDPYRLDPSGVARAAIESLAENASDGIVAPALWLGLFGLPGMALYKAINTADSMIGHLDARYRHFGWAAARLDDFVNLPASRLTGLIIALAGPARAAALTAMGRDAARHASPNAGWPEAAMAGALGIRLGGPRSYQGETVDLAWMGNGRIELGAHDIRAALAIYGRSLSLLAVFIGLAALAARALI